MQNSNVKSEEEIWDDVDVDTIHVFAERFKLLFSGAPEKQKALALVQETLKVGLRGYLVHNACLLNAAKFLYGRLHHIHTAVHMCLVTCTSHAQPCTRQSCAYRPRLCHARAFIHHDALYQPVPA